MDLYFKVQFLFYFYGADKKPEKIVFFTAGAFES